MERYKKCKNSKCHLDCVHLECSLVKKKLLNTSDNSGYETELEEIIQQSIIGFKHPKKIVEKIKLLNTKYFA